MAGRSPHEAVQSFKAALSRAVSCITPSVITLGPRPYEPGPGSKLLALNDNRAVALSHPTTKIALRVAVNYRIVEDPQQRGGWAITTARYEYALEDDQEREFLIYQWHPQGSSPVTYPHLHIGQMAGLPPRGLITSHTHLPTGRIALEDLLRLAIEQLGVHPRRPDWERVLTESQAAFEAVQMRAQSSGKAPG